MATLKDPISLLSAWILFLTFLTFFYGSHSGPLSVRSYYIIILSCLFNSLGPSWPYQEFENCYEEVIQFGINGIFKALVS